MSFPQYKQLDAMPACRTGRDGGPTCLRMIAKYYGKTYSLQNLRDKSYITLNGVSMLGGHLAVNAENQEFILELPMTHTYNPIL
jgi:ABC-type bacteriocin/lantibiotic exporter with double-glycine peptidase domain